MEGRRGGLKTQPRPDRPVLQGPEELRRIEQTLVCEGPAPENPSQEAGPRRGDHAQLNLVAEAGPHDGPDIAEPVHEAEPAGLGADPERPGEEIAPVRG